MDFPLHRTGRTRVPEPQTRCHFVAAHKSLFKRRVVVAVLLAFLLDCTGTFTVCQGRLKLISQDYLSSCVRPFVHTCISPDLNSQKYLPLEWSSTSERHLSTYSTDEIPGKRHSLQSAFKSGFRVFTLLWDVKMWNSLTLVWWWARGEVVNWAWLSTHFRAEPVRSIVTRNCQPASARLRQPSDDKSQRVFSFV